MTAAIRKLFSVMPFLFGIGFIAPLTAQIMVAAGISGPLGLTPLITGLALGAGWGLYAQITGRWL
jgi:hypothetical protein